MKILFYLKRIGLGILVLALLALAYIYDKEVDANYAFLNTLGEAPLSDVSLDD